MRSRIASVKIAAMPNRWSIEIIKPLAQRTWALYDSLILLIPVGPPGAASSQGHQAASAGRRDERGTFGYL